MNNQIINPSSYDLQSILAEIRKNAEKHNRDHIQTNSAQSSSILSTGEYLHELQSTINRMADKSRLQSLINRCEDKLRMKHVLANTIAGWVDNWDVDVTLLVPQSNVAYSSQTHLSKFLNGYFKSLDAIVYGHIPRRQRPKIARFVVNEFADGVGWHCHAVIATPVGFDRTHLDQIMRKTWFERIGVNDNPKFDPSRFYCSQTHNDRYISYSLKHAIEMDNINFDLSKGVIDLYNSTYNNL